MEQEKTTPQAMAIHFQLWQASGFVSVRVKEPVHTSTAWLEIERADGSRIRFYQHVEASFIKSLL